ncbi:MAG: hypothetical protein GY822_26745 [Deltaproteobacteria bacterium]|nr:hypothetical protein [Deltaproteobacteria bacterium]
MKTYVWALMAFLFSSMAQAAPEQVASWDKDGCKASITREGRLTHMTWSAVVDAPLKKVQATLEDWQHAQAVVSGTKQVLLKKKGKAGAHLRVEREAPFFFPDVWFEVKASSEVKVGKVHVVWAFLEGSGEAYRREWTLVKEGNKTRVLHTFQLGLPYDLPNVFVKSRLSQQVEEDLQELRKAIKR